MTSTREKVILSTLACAAAAVALVIASPPAEASPIGFIDQLNRGGITIYDTSKALNTGYAICNALATTNGVDVVENLYRITSWEEVPTRQIAGVWVEAAVEQLCSWHDHRGEVLR